MSAGPPLVVVVVVHVAAGRRQSDEPAAEAPVHLDIALALRRLAKAPLASKARTLYADALRRFGAWLDSPADDAVLTAYLDELFDLGRAPPTCRSGRWTGAGAFGSGVWGRTRCAPRSSTARPRRCRTQ